MEGIARFLEHAGNFTQAMSVYMYLNTFANEGFIRQIGEFNAGVLTGDKVTFMPNAGYEDAVDAGCNPTYSSGTWGTSDTWEIKNKGIYKYWCSDDLEAEVKRSAKLHNLSENDFFKKFMTRTMTDSLANSVFANALFGDKTSTNVRLQSIDGVIKQVMKFATNDPARRIALENNSKSTFAEKGSASDTLMNLIMEAPTELRSSGDSYILMTQKTYDDLQVDVINKRGLYLNEQLTQLENGFKATEWQGVKLIINPNLDKVISTLNGNPLKEVGPQFALFTTKSNIQFGSSSDKQAGVGVIDIWEEKKEQQTYAKVEYSLGVKVMRPELIQVMY